MRSDRHVDLNPKGKRNRPTSHQIRRSKTPADWRDPSLNDACARALKELRSRATSWRSAWRSLRRAAGLDRVRFHDGRHMALTRLSRDGATRLARTM
jgi:hypothetical protein